MFLFLSVAFYSIGIVLIYKTLCSFKQELPLLPNFRFLRVGSNLNVIVQKSAFKVSSHSKNLNYQFKENCTSMKALCAHFQYLVVDKSADTIISKDNYVECFSLGQ